MITAGIGAAIGGVVGGVSSYIESGGNWGEALKGAGRGALVGGIVGLTGGAVGGAILGAAGVTAGTAGTAMAVGATLTAGGVGAVSADIVGQTLNWGLDQVMGGKNEGKSFFESYDVQQTLIAGAGGVLTAGQGLGLGRVFGMARPVCNPSWSQSLKEHAFHGADGLIGGLVSDGVSQGIDIASGRQKSWDWGRFKDAGTQGAITGIANYRATRGFLAACFAAGTPLLTEDGSKPIEQIQVGDKVLSRSEYDSDGPLAWKVVEELFVRTGRIMSLRVAGQQIQTTAEHPFWVKGKAWTNANELQVGDLLISHEGQWSAIEVVLTLAIMLRFSTCALPISTRTLWGDRIGASQYGPTT